MYYTLIALWVNYAPGSGYVAENTQIHTEKFQQMDECEAARDLMVKFDPKIKAYCINLKGESK